VLYLDSSALIKNYINELGTPELQARLRKETEAGTELFTSVLTYAEMHAIVARKFREGNLSKSNAAKTHDQFDEHWLSVFTQVEVSSTVLGFVREIVNVSTLRGADTLHLASALSVRDIARTGGKSETYASELTFLSSDKQLLAAAKKQGIVTFDPTQANQPER
jgi:predicted nucleic acid-binding protein